MHSNPAFCSLQYKISEAAAQTSVTTMQVIVVNLIIFTATRNHVRKPLTAIAVTFENIQPLSRNLRNNLPVNGIAAAPSTSASRYHVQNVHTSPCKRNADSATIKSAGIILKICLVIVSGFINPYSPIF